jgi:hypothetical protein
LHFQFSQVKVLVFDENNLHLILEHIMAAKDFYHDKLKNALIKDGWLITHDPYIIDIPEMRPRQEIDLGAEKIIAAERGVDKIAVEVKSFLNASLVYDFHHALGQFMLYLIGLDIKEPSRNFIWLSLPMHTTTLKACA